MSDQAHSHAIRRRFALADDVLFLNHGSFGACPREVLALQSELRERLEREPVQFMLKERPRLLDEARVKVAAFVGAAPEDLAFVPNATSGVNAVLRSLRFEPGDEILVTDHGYHACSNAARFVAERAGARVVTVKLPFPLISAEEVILAIHGAVTERTRVALLDHVTSPTGLVMPLDRLVAGLEARGVMTLVDGAHGPGMLELDLPKLGASFYTGNLHKWCCAPKGAALLWLRPDMAEAVHAPIISHGFDSTRARPRLWEEFDWMGTADPTAWLCAPAALDALAAMAPGGWPELHEANRALALEARDMLCDALEVEAPAPDGMLGSLAAVPLPEAPEARAGHFELSPLATALYERHRIDVPIVPWPGAGHRLVRVSAHVYNRREEYQALAKALLEELARESKG
ncbi:MAG: aminotransferase class V-fold PLP-dependent enzyme [Deltaproteobacteria bacterium]|nr:aminotransferase class V-fold PLP-dependent enzyme [Deltaproteobacteria bacterium]